MKLLLVFFIAFAFSFIGSIPPGTLNLTIIQLGLEHRIAIAWRFAIATALIEYPYAWLAIEFESLITSSPAIIENIQLIAALVMVMLGVVNVWAAKKQGRFYQRFNDSGFRRGIILGVLNPMALPFWIGVTAYLKSQQWITLSSWEEKHCYLAGVSLGALTLFMTLAYLAKRVISQFQHNTLLKKIPGIILLALGIYGLLDYWL